MADKRGAPRDLKHRPAQPLHGLRGGNPYQSEPDLQVIKQVVPLAEIITLDWEDVEEQEVTMPKMSQPKQKDTVHCNNKLSLSKAKKQKASADVAVINTAKVQGAVPRMSTRKGKDVSVPNKKDQVCNKRHLRTINNIDVIDLELGVPPDALDKQTAESTSSGSNFSVKEVRPPPVAPLDDNVLELELGMESKKQAPRKRRPGRPPKKYVQEQEVQPKKPFTSAEKKQYAESKGNKHLTPAEKKQYDYKKSTLPSVLKEKKTLTAAAKKLNDEPQAELSGEDDNFELVYTSSSSVGDIKCDVEFELDADSRPSTPIISRAKSSLGLPRFSLNQGERTLLSDNKKTTSFTPAAEGEVTFQVERQSESPDSALGSGENLSNSTQSSTVASVKAKSLKNGKLPPDTREDDWDKKIRDNCPLSPARRPASRTSVESYWEPIEAKINRVYPPQKKSPSPQSGLPAQPPKKSSPAPSPLPSEPQPPQRSSIFADIEKNRRLQIVLTDCQKKMPTTENKLKEETSKAPEPLVLSTRVSDESPIAPATLASLVPSCARPLLEPLAPLGSQLPFNIDGERRITVTPNVIMKPPISDRGGTGKSQAEGRKRSHEESDDASSFSDVTGGRHLQGPYRKSRVIGDLTGDPNVGMQSNGEHVVEAVKAQRIINGRTYFMVQWKGWSDAYNTWEPLRRFAGFNTKCVHAQYDLRRAEQMVERMEATSEHVPELPAYLCIFEQEFVMTLTDHMLVVALRTLPLDLPPLEDITELVEQNTAEFRQLKTIVENKLAELDEGRQEEARDEVEDDEHTNGEKKAESKGKEQARKLSVLTTAARNSDPERKRKKWSPPPEAINDPARASDVTLWRGFDKRKGRKTLQLPSVELSEEVKRIFVLRELQRRRLQQAASLLAWEKIMHLPGTPPIRVTNEVDLEEAPFNFHYLSRSKVDEEVHISHEDVSPCTCAPGECGPKCRCVLRCGKTPAYNSEGQMQVPAHVSVFECSSLCSCGDKCQNRVIQRGRKVAIEIYRTVDRGWAVRTLEDIPKGTFVCEYLAEILLKEEVDSRAHSGRYTNVPICLFDLNSTGRKKEDYKYTMDAAEYGNEARFLNHSCEPNCTMHNVWVEWLDPFVPRLAIFSIKDIRAGEELTYDYCSSNRKPTAPTSGKRKLNSISWRVVCRCNSTYCRGYVFRPSPKDV